jgi:hypothetical protein
MDGLLINGYRMRLLLLAISPWSPEPVRMKRTLAAIAVLILGSGTGQAWAAEAVQSIAIPTVVCRSTGELCDPPYSVLIAVDGAVDVNFRVPSNYCSSVRIHFLIDGTEVAVSSFLGWLGATDQFADLPLETGFITLPTVPGTHVLGIQAEGQPSGCNVGTLGEWAGAIDLRRESTVAASYTSTVLADQPISYWPLADQGGSATDVRGMNPGWLRFNVRTGVPGPVAGMSAMRFPGGSTSGACPESGMAAPCACPGIDIAGDPRALAFRREGAVEAWVRTSAPLPGGASILRWRWFGYGLLIGGYSAYPYPGRPVFGITTELDSIISEQAVGGPTAPPVDDGSWHHLVASWDGATLMLWVDAVQYDQKPKGGQAYYAPDVGTQHGEFAIGRDGDACDTFAPAFAGDMAHVAIYGHALPADRVLTHFLAGSGVVQP